MLKHPKEETSNDRTLSWLARGGLTPRVAEEALRHSEAMYRNLIEQIPAIVYITELSPESVGCYASPQIEAITGFAPSEWCVKPSLWRRLIHPEDREAVLSALDKSIETNQPFFAEYRLYKKNGELMWVRDHGNGIRDENGKLIFFQGLMMDITSQKELEHEKILKGQKLESLGVLAGGIAHDFNNLLTSILGYSSLVLAQSDESSKEMIRQIELAAQQGADLTRQLLAYAGKGKFVLEPIDLNELVQEMLQLLKMAVSQKGSLIPEFEENLPAIEADATQIRQLVMNVITNASDALEDRTGTITMRTRSVDMDPAYLDREGLDPGMREGSYVLFEVSDTGVGMSEETKSRMFDPFYTTKPNGRGLGLAAVMGIVKGHNGIVQVLSAPDQGSTFRAYFPASPKTAPTLQGETVDRGAWRGSGAILLVDDDENVRNVASTMLQRAGFSVLTAKDGQESIDVFKDRSGEIVAVLMDVKMPNLNGLTASRELKHLCPDLPIILMSGFYDQEFTRQFSDIGLSGFLQKPFKATDITEKLQNALTAAPSLN